MGISACEKCINENDENQNKAANGQTLGQKSLNDNLDIEKSIRDIFFGKLKKKFPLFVHFGQFENFVNQYSNLIAFLLFIFPELGVEIRF